MRLLNRQGKKAKQSGTLQTFTKEDAASTQALIKGYATNIRRDIEVPAALIQQDLSLAESLVQALADGIQRVESSAPVPPQLKEALPETMACMGPLNGYSMILTNANSVSV